MKDREIGITLNLSPAYPAVENDACQIAANRWDGFFNRWFLDPIFKGEYPQDLWDHYEQALLIDYSYIQPQDLQQISSSIDFLGINYYTPATLQSGHQGEFSFLEVEPISTGRPVTAMNWEIDPQALYDVLMRIQKDYGDIPIYITENGAAYDDVVVDGEVRDFKRISYIRDHLEMCLKAIEDGVNLKGYYVWSFLDNFEWAFGYQKRFGIVYVDYQTQQRLPKQSAYWFRQVIRQNGLPIE
ncbi:beta-glucosidase [Lihuaxuella thermophila]|uniref:beta-glucosidase n=1 Tax=Lihuaxuella thermophila TaxID=1173111 RepID=A0A1H8FE91_9BACL|nr:beta-glucosidase [Lihuaxuella thermophila]